MITTLFPGLCINLSNSVDIFFRARTAPGLERKLTWATRARSEHFCLPLCITSIILHWIPVERIEVTLIRHWTISAV